MKLNRYMSLRILDVDKIYIAFYGNKRGFRLNVGAGQNLNLMSVNCDSSKQLPTIAPPKDCGGYDYIRGRYNSRPTGYMDKVARYPVVSSREGNLGGNGSTDDMTWANMPGYTNEESAIEGGLNDIECLVQNCFVNECQD
jgi:hypothetical protein